MDGPGLCVQSRLHHGAEDARVNDGARLFAEDAREDRVGVLEMILEVE